MNVIPQAVKDGFVRLTGPMVRALVRGHVRPNTITTIGALVVIGSAVAYGMSAIRLGGLLLLLSGLFDILDGQVARQGGPSSALFAGIALHFLRGGLPAAQVAVGVMLAIAALSASLMVSYTRARAEGLGIECKVGIAARAERILVLGAPTLFFGAGPGGRLLLWIMAVLALATATTVVQRIVHVAGVAAGSRTARASRRRDTQPGHASLRKGN